jgi:hypothetical protein
MDPKKKAARCGWISKAKSSVTKELDAGIAFIRSLIEYLL